MIGKNGKFRDVVCQIMRSDVYEKRKITARGSKSRSVNEVCANEMHVIARKASKSVLFSSDRHHTASAIE